jgi:GT2 family glycosyltransferase
MKNIIKITVITSLYNCIDYLNGFFDVVEQIQNKDEIEFLLLHNAPNKEEIDLIGKRIQNKAYYRYVQVKQLEGLYSTWNRGIKLSSGKYLAIWNVDDVRTPDSLLMQANALDATPLAAMTYGNYILTPNYGSKNGTLVDEIDCNLKINESRVSHIVGCFPMWRKEIHNSIGYFDEQFKLVSDYEFQIRTALNYPLVKTNSMLGYYLEGCPKRLSKNTTLQNQERTAIELRYGVFYKLNLLYKRKANNYKVGLVYSFGKYTPVKEYIPSYQSYIQSKKNGWLWAYLLFPLNLIRYIKQILL